MEINETRAILNNIMNHISDLKEDAASQICQAGGGSGELANPPIADVVVELVKKGKLICLFQQ